MPPRTRYHEPIVQTEPPPADELPMMPGMLVEHPGVYLNCEHVSAYLARLAERYHGEGRMALLDAAQAFAGAALVEGEGEALTAADAPPELPPDVPIYESLASSDEQQQVARIELYPNAEGKWETRGCDADGNIIVMGPSDFFRDVAEANARVRWPDPPMFELPDAMGDSLWNEQRSMAGQSTGVLSGRPRPSPRRLFLTQTERPESARPV